MLRKGESVVNTRRNGELVPKYPLDLLGLEKNSDRPEAFWLLNATTTDHSGYIAGMLKSSCIQVGPTVLVLAAQSSMVERKQNDGTIKIDFPDSQCAVATTTGLDLSTFEWRGIHIYNEALLNRGNDTHTKYHFVSSSNPNTCFILALSSKSVAIYRLSNLIAVQTCFTKAVNDHRKLSKKKTVSYLLKKAEKERVRALRECILCRAFESGGCKFMCCGQCKVHFYCSKKCQRRHWKTHKHECVAPFSPET